MSPRTLRGRLGLLLVSFFLLVMVSVGVTLRSLRAQEKDALVVNLSGRQRMLTQRMTWLALSRPHDPALSQSIARFEQTLHALKEGGQTLDAFDRLVDIPPAPDEQVRASLDQASDSWSVFRETILQLQAASDETPPDPDLADQLRAESQIILAELDEVVSSFEARARAKVLRLWTVQAVFLGCALALLLGGTLFTHRHLVAPLEKLGQVARRIGAGDLDAPVPRMNTDELGELADVMEGMRAEIRVAHRQLESRARQRTRELEEAFGFSQEIIAQLDLDTLLRSVTDRARKLMRARESRLCLIGADGRNLELVSSEGGPAPVDGVHQSLNDGIALEVLGQEKTVISSGPGCASCVYLDRHAPGTCAAAPLKTGSTTLGALCVVRGDETSYSPEEINALTLLANTAAIAIANAQLLEQERQQAHRSAALAERERLAEELHDNLAQTLSYLRLKTEQLEPRLRTEAGKASADLQDVQRTIDTAYGQVRDAISGITPSTTRRESLRERLARCVVEFESAASIPVHFTVDSLEDVQLSDVTQTQVLHILREALTNVHRHARATQVIVQGRHNNGTAHFEVCDNGCGFDPHGTLADDNLGLKIMRTRAERIGGRLEILSSPGNRTRVLLMVPTTKEVT